MVLWQLETVQIVMGNTSVVLSIGMGPMPAIVDLWGYDVQNSSCCSSRSTPITQKSKT